jgi:predicted dehydrogenase
MSSDGPLRFALLGCGTIAPTHAKALAALTPHAELAACADVLPERAETFAREHRCAARPWESVLKDPSIGAVTICTPSGQHAEQAVAALRAGKHVLVEKPMDVTTAACDRILTAQKETGNAFAVISQHRYDPATLRLRQLLDAGDLGRIFGVEIRIPWFRTQAYYDEGDWRGTWAMDGGGALINQGVHTLDLALWLGGPVRRVWARTLQATHERIEVEDHLCATLEFANGAVGTLLASTSIYPGFPARLEFYGTNGSALLEGDAIHTIALKNRPLEKGSAHPEALHIATGGTRSATDQSTDQPLGDQWAWGDAHRAQIQDFVHACAEKRTPLVDAVAGRRAVAVIESIYRSARTGQSVSVPESI